MLVVIYNDAAYGAEVHHFGPMGRPVEVARFPETDFASARTGGRSRGHHCQKRRRPFAGSGLVGRRDRPLVVDAKVNPEVRAEWLAEAFRAH